MRRTHVFIAGVCIGLAMTTRAAATPDDVLKGLEDLMSGKHQWEGAVGLTMGYGPAYVGSDDYNIGLKPALYLRYGRFSLSSGAGFATRRADQVLRGLGADLGPPTACA